MSWKIDQRVLFGRGNGVKTLGVITKLNKSRAKVMQLEERQGSRKCHKTGTIWNIPYNCLHPIVDEDSEVVSIPEWKKLLYEALCAAYEDVETPSKVFEGLFLALGGKVSQDQAMKYRG